MQRKLLLAALLAVAPTLALSQTFPSSGGGSGGGGGGANPCSTTASSIQYEASSTSFGCVANWTSNGTALILSGAVNGDIATFGSSHQVLDSGTLLSSLAPLNSPTLTTPTISGALTYGGVTLASAVTGTGNMVLATSPSLTTPNIGAATATNIGVTGTSLPTQASGTLGIGGTQVLPTLGATAEGDFLLSATQGLIAIGDGSTDDFSLYNKSGTLVLAVPTGVNQVAVQGQLVATATAGSVSAPQVVLNSTNTGVYSPGASQLCAYDIAGSCKLDYGITTGGQFTINAVLVASTGGSYELSSGASSSTAPTLIPNKASATTGFGASASGAISAIETNVEVWRVGTGSHFYGVGFATAAANETGYLCYNSGSTPANELLLDTVTCLASLEWMKNIESYMGDEALQETMKLKPFWYTWNQKTHPSSDKHVQPGLGAIATEKVDPRLVTYTPGGKLKGVRYEQMVALLVADVQQQQKEIDGLKEEIKHLRGARK